MPKRVDEVQASFVEFVPDELEKGVVYISIPYRTASHLCCCGCGDKVVTPIRPANWSLTYDGETVGLRPSIGGGRCNSHYFITSGRVEWCRPLSKAQAAAAVRRDVRDARGQFEPPPVPERISAPWWRRVLERFPHRERG